MLVDTGLRAIARNDDVMLRVSRIYLYKLILVRVPFYLTTLA